METTLTTNGVNGHANGHGQANGKPKSSPFEGRRVRNYRPGYGNWLWHPARRDGRFQLYDVPAMLDDHAVNIGLNTIYGPLFGAEFEVRANSKDIKTFVENTLYRFWHHDLQKVLNHYVPWGTAVCEVLYEPDPETGLWRYAGMDDFETRHVQALRTTQGRQLTGARVSYGTTGYVGQITTPKTDADGNEWNVLRHPKLFWCAHRPMCGMPFGKSTLSPSWDPWMEKAGSHGANSIRKLWAFGNAFRGCWVRYPAGGSQLRNGVLVDNQDIAREIAEAYSTGGVGAIPSETDEHGNQLWEVIDPVQNGEIASLMQYPSELDRLIWQGMGVLDEVIHAPDTGGSWSGRSGPLLIFLNIEDMRVREIVTAFDVGPSGYTTRNEQSGGVIRPLVMENFGSKAKYEIRPISLVPKPAEPGAGGTPGSAPGMGSQGPGPQGMGAPPQPAGGNPVQLSAAGRGVDLPDDAVAAILAGKPIALSGGLFDEEAHPREDSGRFTHKPISATHVKAAQKAFSKGKLSVKHSAEPITSAASGAKIHHHVELESGQHVHPDELHRLKIEDGEAVLHHDEGLTIHEPGGQSKAKSLGHALSKISAFSGKPDEPVTIVSKHGYSATRPRGEWMEHHADHDGQSFSEWYDAKGHKHTGRQVEQTTGGATEASGEDTERFFAQQTGGQGRLDWDGKDAVTVNPNGNLANPEESGFLDMLLNTPASNFKGEGHEKATALFKDSTERIEALDKEIKDWESRKYKKNTGKVQVGGEHGDEVSIGQANEARRKRRLDNLYKELGEAQSDQKKATLQLNRLEGRPDKEQRSKLSAAHDVATEKRADDGKWTAGGATAQKKPKRPTPAQAAHAKNQQQQSSKPSEPSVEISPPSGTFTKIADVGKKVLGGALDLEHGAKEAIKGGFETLHPAVKAPVTGFLKLFYGTYVIAQKAVDEVCKEEGWTEKGKERLASVVGAIDCVGMKVNAVAGTAVAGPVGGAVASFAPIASLAFLAYSLVANTIKGDPMLVVRAAKRAIADYAASLKPELGSGQVESKSEERLRHEHEAS